MAKRNFIPLVPSGTINADASVAQLEQDVLAMDAKVGELAEDIGDTEQEINQLKSAINEVKSGFPQESASGSIVTIEDGADNVPVVSLTVDINPVQDLHGYDSPWPAGGGNNKMYRKDSVLPHTENGITFAADGTDGVKITGTATGTIGRNVFVVDVEEGKTYTISASVSMVQGIYINLPSFLNGVSKGNIGGGITRDNPSITFTASGIDKVEGRITIDSGINANGIVIGMQCEEGSSATSWSPYENLCPISGWDKVGLWQRGKNLFAPVAYAGGTYNPTVGSTWNLTEITGARKPVLTEDGFTVKASANNQTWTFIQPVEYGVDYYLSVKFASDVSVLHSIGYLDKNFKVLSRINNTSSGAHTIEGQISPLKNAAYRYLLVANATGTTETITFTKPSLVIGSSAVEYVPYNPASRDIIIQLGDTYYGAQLDVLTGVMTVDTLYKALTGAETVQRQSQSGGAYYRFNISGVISDNPALSNVVFPKFCSHFKPISYTQLPNQDNSISRFQNDTTAYIRCDTYTSAADFKAFLAEQYAAGTPVQIGSPRATPIEIQLTPEQVNSFFGTNNIWADTGDTHAIYRADIGLYIQKLTGSTEEDMTANVNIASGKYFLVGNTLYLSTSAIAAGEQIVPGTNCTLTNLAAALNALNS